MERCHRCNGVTSAVSSACRQRAPLT
jgi:hypothetical protein